MKNRQVCLHRPQSEAVKSIRPGIKNTVLTRQKITMSLAVLCLCSFITRGEGIECVPEADASEPFIIDKMRFINHPVFDEDDAGSLYLHHVANWLHINTQPQVIEDLLPFAETDSVSLAQLSEAERLLNQHSFLRKSQISRINDCQNTEKNSLKVETWDTWSLMPSVSFGRRAGNNKYAFGFKEDNFLGLGIHAGVQYKKDHLRSGYQFAFNMPLSFPQHSSFELEFADNDDGQKTSVSFAKPFYLQSSPQQYAASILKENRRDSIYQNGDLAWQFSHDIKHMALSYGHLITQNEQGAFRVHLGINKEQDHFADLGSDVLSFLPSDRGFTAPWLGLEYKQADYKIFSNIRFIDHREDINLGWQFMTKFGVDTASSSDNNERGIHFENSLTKGLQLNNTLLLFSVSNKVYWQEKQADHQELSAEFELHQYFSSHWSAYLKSQYLSEKNQYLDAPLALGGDTGVRGYSSQYQHGEHLWSANAELRFNPHWELYQLINVAWAGFVDSGRAWGNTENANSTNSSLHSLGIGARLFSSHSSEGNVVHMDIIKPLTTGANIDSWQWRLQVKKSL
jgi:hypothetical protein